MTTATIEIFVRPVGGTFGLAQHLYLVSTDSQGHKKILRAGTEMTKETGMLTDDLKVVYLPYIEENKELFDGNFNPENKVKVYTVTGTDTEIESKMEKMWEIGKQINAGNYDYKLPTALCPESICHVQNSNTAANLFTKAIDVDLKPILEEKKIWAPGIDGHLDHTMMDKFTHDYIDDLQVMQGVLDGVREAKSQNTNIGLETIFSQAKKKVEQFRFHREEYSAAEENTKFAELMKDLDLSFVLDNNKNYKYMTYSYYLHNKYYANSVTEIFNKYILDRKKAALAEGDDRESDYAIKNVTEYKVFYELNIYPSSKIRYSFHTDGVFEVENNIAYDPNYMPVLSNQCNSLSGFRDRSSPLHEKLDEICTFIGVDHTLSHTEL